MKLYNKLRKKIKAKEDEQSLSDSRPRVGEISEILSQERPKNNEFKPKNLWEIAWNELDAKDQQMLAGEMEAAQDDQTGRASTVDLVDQVIQSTEASYKESQKKASTSNARFRELAHRVLDASLSFKGIISAAVAFDPTGHASSAWTVISLGLTMTQNHHDIRIAVFESSAFLTDFLARCAFVENEHYRDNHPGDKTLMETTLTQVYKGLLQYAAQLKRAQQESGGKKLLESLSSAGDHPIKQLETKIINDEKKLQTWATNDAYLRHKKKADDMLARIDESITLMKGLHRKLDLNNLTSAGGASFDSYLNQHEDECLPGTREALLQQVYDWANAPQSQTIFWLNGMAGTGKSTISRTVARVFRDQGQLGASFFFKKGEADRGNAKRFFPTLTRQIVTTFPDIASSVSAAIESDPDIAAKSFRDQFTALLLQPLCEIKPEKKKRNMILVIDALDECDGDEDIKMLLRLLPLFEQVEAMKIRIFVTSRPELPIRLGFQTSEVKDKHQDLILHEVPKPVIKEDLSLFLKHKLSQIQTDRSLPEGWLDDDDFINLVNMSVPLFIFAATVCRVFEDPDLLPMESLRDILAHQNEESRLDATYIPVLQSLFSNAHSDKTRKKMVEEFREIVGTILILETPLSVISLSKLLCFSVEKISIRLNRLHAVLRIPDNENEPIRLFHLSFRDFLLDPKNSEKTDLYVDSGLSNQNVAERCLNIMTHGLKRNICNLEFEGMPRAEIDPDTIRDSIPTELQYCCRYWTQHLEMSADPIFMIRKASTFLQEYFIYWAEVMCILGCGFEIAEGIERLRNVLNALHNERMAATAAFLLDAQRFILQCQHITDNAPLQLYCSGLLFAPERSLIKERFRSDIPEWICQFPRVEENWSAEIQIFEGHTDDINSVAFSADGKWLASGSADSTVKIWNPNTGALHITIKPSGYRVDSVAFSPDCQSLASAHSDGAVKVLDPQDGTLRLDLRGHTRPVNSVAFSKTANFLASGSADTTVKIWSTESGRLVRTLHGHDHGVLSVDFSSDGRWLASGSMDGNINIWDPETYKLQLAMCYSGEMLHNISVAFSPDGRWLASVSFQGAIKIWDLETGTLQRSLQQNGSIGSLAFSPDGQWLVAVLGTGITIWDFETGSLHGILERHGIWPGPIAFSPDGKRVASGSSQVITMWDPHAELYKLTPNTEQLRWSDEEYFGETVDAIEFSRPAGRLLAFCSMNNVGVWDPENGTLKQVLSTYPLVTKYMALSHPDGRFLASGHDDGSIEIWDLELSAKRTTLAGLGYIGALAFSNSGARWLASGSSNGTVMVWDLETGTAKHTLEGHRREVSCVAFSPSDAKCLVSSSRDKTIKIWDLESGRLKYTLKGNDGPIEYVAFSHPCGQWLASTSLDSIKIWDPVTGTMQREISFEGELLARNENMMEIHGETFNTTITLRRYLGHFIRPKSDCDVQICIWQDWIFIKGKPVLWIPLSYRPRYAAVIGSRLAMSHLDGRVSFMKFRY